jgi:hypothetical protein
MSPHRELNEKLLKPMQEFSKKKEINKDGNQLEYYQNHNPAPHRSPFRYKMMVRSSGMMLQIINLFVDMVQFLIGCLFVEEN